MYAGMNHCVFHKKLFRAEWVVGTDVLLVVELLLVHDNDYEEWATMGSFLVMERPN